MFASEVVAARWLAAKRRLEAMPTDSTGATELQALADQLRSEYNAIVAITVDPPPPPVDTPPDQPLFPDA
jgi:hypothetical protein